MNAQLSIKVIDHYLIECFVDAQSDGDDRTSEKERENLQFFSQTDLHC